MGTYVFASKYFQIFGVDTQRWVAGSYSNSILNYLRTSILFSIVAVQFYIPNSNEWFLFFHNLSTTYYLSVNSYSNKRELVSHCSFEFHFPNSQYSCSSFNISVGLLYVILGEESVWVICTFFKWDCLFDVEFYVLKKVYVFFLFLPLFPLLLGSNL